MADPVGITALDPVVLNDVPMEVPPCAPSIPPGAVPSGDDVELACKDSRKRKRLYLEGMITASPLAEAKVRKLRVVSARGAVHVTIADVMEKLADLSNKVADLSSKVADIHKEMTDNHKEIRAELWNKEMKERNKKNLKDLTKLVLPMRRTQDALGGHLVATAGAANPIAHHWEPADDEEVPGLHDLVALPAGLTWGRMSSMNNKQIDRMARLLNNGFNITEHDSLPDRRKKLQLAFIGEQDPSVA